MNWTSILIAGLAGAIAGGLARLLVDPKENKGGYGVAFAILFAALYLGSRLYILPTIEMRKAEAKLQEIPAFKAIKLHDSETYAQIMVEVKSAMKAGSGEARYIAIVREHVTRIVQKRLPKASNEAVVAYIGATMVELDELYKRGDDLCHRFLFPQPGDALDARAYFSQETQDADLAALARVIETSARDPQRVPEDFEVLPKLQPIFEDLASEYGSQVALLQRPNGFGVNKRKVCEIASGMYDKILALPVDDSGRILRFLVSQG